MYSNLNTTVTIAMVTLTPESMPVVETLKSMYAISSAVGAL